MTRRSKTLLLAGLVLSLLGNVFQLLWASSEDAVVTLTRREMAAMLEEVGETHRGSAVWSEVLVDRPDLVVLSTGSMVNFRGWFTGRAKRTVYIATQ
ncbi:MAG: hypothetical protein KDB80_05430 [Planctomycetes bacterium]|nr:hypothetical protein [Planctomycetota bacterium]